MVLGDKMRERLRTVYDPVKAYRRPPAVPCQTWEYAVVQMAATEDFGGGDAVRGALAEMGALGWELVKWEAGRGVGVRGSAADLVLIFKRPTS